MPRKLLLLWLSPALFNNTHSVAHTAQCTIKVHVLFWLKPLPNGMSQFIQHAIVQTVHDETWYVM